MIIIKKHPSSGKKIKKLRIESTLNNKWNAKQINKLTKTLKKRFEKLTKLTMICKIFFIF